jgi:hypothetical protein
MDRTLRHAVLIQSCLTVEDWHGFGVYAHASASDLTASGAATEVDLIGIVVVADCKDGSIEAELVDLDAELGR